KPFDELLLRTSREAVNEYAAVAAVIGLGGGAPVVMIIAGTVQRSSRRVTWAARAIALQRTPEIAGGHAGRASSASRSGVSSSSESRSAAASSNAIILAQRGSTSISSSSALTTRARSGGARAPG